jgi:hypothetical protein
VKQKVALKDPPPKKKRKNGGLNDISSADEYKYKILL